MIDTAKPHYHITNLVLDRLQDSKAIGLMGMKLYGNGFYLKHPFGYKNPKVHFNPNKMTLVIEASLPKLLQGHNVFGCNQVEYLCLKVLELIYQRLGLPFTTRERRRVRDEGIRLGRLDTTCSFRLTTRQDVTSALEAFWEQLRAEGRDWAIEGSDDFQTVYHQKHSSRVTEKLYDKYAELDVGGHRISSSVAKRALIIEYAKYLLRFEVTWRAMELRRLGFEYADAWTPRIVREMTMERLGNLNLQGHFKERLPAIQFDNLNLGTRTFYDIREQGCNLRPHRRYTPLKRARQTLLKHGVDIFRHQVAGSEIALNEVLVEENAYFVAPKKLVRQGLIVGVKALDC